VLERSEDKNGVKCDIKSTHTTNKHNIFLRKSERKTQIGIPRHRWEYDIVVDLNFGVNVDWILLAYGMVQWWPFCDYGNEPTSSKKTGDFPDQLRHYQHFKMDTAPWN